MFRHVLRNTSYLSKNFFFVKRGQKMAPKTVKDEGCGLKECYVIFKGGYSKVLCGVTGGRGGGQICLKKALRNF